MSPPSGTGEAVQYNQPRSRQVMLLGNSWQQQLGRDKPLPPMIPELKGTGFNLESDPHGLGLVIQGRGNSDSYAGQDRGEDSLGDVGLYSSSSLMKAAATARSPGIFETQSPTHTKAALATFQSHQPRKSTKSPSTEHSSDIFPTAVRSSVSTYVEPTIKISKFYSSSVARPFSGRTNFSGSTYRE